MSPSEEIICCFVQHPRLENLVENIANELRLAIYRPNSIEEIFEEDRSFLWFIVELDATDPDVKNKLENRFRQEFSVPIAFVSIDPSQKNDNYPIEIRIAFPDNPTDFLHNILHAIHTDQECEKKSTLVRNYGNLSKREKEVLRHVNEGKNNKEIARLLYISPRTVETHRSHILQKMKIDSFLALACSHINDSI